MNDVGTDHIVRYQSFWLILKHF